MHFVKVFVCLKIELQNQNSFEYLTIQQQKKKRFSCASFTLFYFKNVQTYENVFALAAQKQIEDGNSVVGS